MKERRLRIGVFGVGRMGQVHVESLVHLALAKEIEFAAIGDRHLPSVEGAGKLIESLAGSEFALRCQRFDRPEGMAESADLDAVVIGSRIADHARDILPFAKKRIPVLVEKPLVGSLAEIASLMKQVDEDALQRIQIAFQRFYDPAMQQAMTWLEQGKIGEIQQSHHVIQDKNPPPIGYLSGGIVSDMMVHLIFESMCFHRFELPRSIQAVRFLAPHYLDQANEGANIVHCFCSWENGSLAHLWGSRLNATGYDNGFKLIGTEGRVDVGEFVGDFGLIQAKLWQGTGRTPTNQTNQVHQESRGVLTESMEYPMTKPSSRHPDFYPRYANAFSNEVEFFIDSVRTNRPFEIGFDVGWKTILIANLASHSANNKGEPIDIAWNGKGIDSIDSAIELASSLVRD